MQLPPMSPHSGRPCTGPHRLPSCLLQQPRVRPAARDRPAPRCFLSPTIGLLALRQARNQAYPPGGAEATPLRVRSGGAPPAAAGSRERRSATAAQATGAQAAAQARHRRVLGAARREACGGQCKARHRRALGAAERGPARPGLRPCDAEKSSPTRHGAGWAPHPPGPRPRAQHLHGRWYALPTVEVHLKRLPGLEAHT
jgi:hypothetical protein